MSDQTQHRDSLAAPARFAGKRTQPWRWRRLKLFTVLKGRRLGPVVVMLVQLGTSGCYCYRLDFVAFEGQPDVRMVDRTMRVREYGSWTIWPIPARYEVVRRKYTIEILTVIPHGNPPSIVVRAYTREGGDLQTFADGRLHRRQWMPAIGTEPKEGSISFAVLSEGKRIGSETFRYEIQSRPFAWEWDLP